jgi:hypothetical protein
LSITENTLGEIFVWNVIWLTCSIIHTSLVIGA